MKISPVPAQGIPTLQQSLGSGIAPEKLAKLKAMMTGEAAPEAKPEEAPQPLPKMNSIKMNTNRTITSDVAIPEEVPVAEATEPETAISDNNVQANDAEVTQPISPQLAAIARQKRALQVKERELLEKEKSLGGSTRAELEARIKSKPLSVLQELGVTYDQLTNDILTAQGQISPEVESLKAEIEALKKGVDERFSATEVAQESHAINYVADKLDAIIDTEDFELLKEAEGGEEVIRRVYTHWKKTGKELDVAKVAKEYQDELLEEAERYAKLKQVQSRLTPQEPPPLEQKSGIRTLTNKDSARTQMDRRQRAILAMQGQLKR